MRKVDLFVCGLLLFQHSSSQSPAPANMFRDNVTHNSYLASPDDLVYDTRAWMFDAGAPVRATPLVDKNGVYFGTAKGDFFALDKKTAKLIWRYSAARAIHSSAACVDGKLFFTDNRQTLYCLREDNGALVWKLNLGEKRPYPWRFDYYYSSPVIDHGEVIVGSDDGNLYAVTIRNGTVAWKFKSAGLVRSTPAIYENQILFGDTEGIFYCLDRKGQLKWSYKTIGHPMDLDSFGFDRKAILGAPVISQGKILFGGRDGYLYALHATDGTLAWTMNHEVSWVISTVAVKDSIVVTGTSDGRFVQAISLATGKQIWKYILPLATWSSPLINNNRVYDACFDGQVYCLDLATGKYISQFSTGAMILSSPVIRDQLLYIGSDDGHLYALKGQAPVPLLTKEPFVYYDAEQIKLYFRNGADIRIRNFLQGAGFRAIGTDTLSKVMSVPGLAVIVFATNYFPKAIIHDGEKSILRKFLDGGGRIVLLGNDPLTLDVEESTKSVTGFAKGRLDSVTGLQYGPMDTRAFGGFFPCFSNERGKAFGLADFWVASLSIEKNQVDIVLGENENNLASAFIKKYANGGKLIQLYLDPDLPTHLDAVVRLARAALDE